MASMVMMAPWMSMRRSNSGMAVISLDLSSQATCPSDKPSWLAQTLTECSAPSPLALSWLRRLVLPSMASTGRSMSNLSMALSFSAFSHSVKQA